MRHSPSSFPSSPFYNKSFVFVSSFSGSFPSPKKSVAIFSSLQKNNDTDPDFSDPSLPNGSSEM